MKIALLAGEEGALRLVPLTGNSERDVPGLGILELFHAGAWGTICDDDMYNSDDYDLTPTGAVRELLPPYVCVCM